MTTVTVVLPDGFDEVMRRMLIQDGQVPPIEFDDQTRAMLIRSFVYAFLQSSLSVPGMDAYAAAYQNANRPLTGFHD